MPHLRVSSVGRDDPVNHQQATEDDITDKDPVRSDANVLLSFSTSATRQGPGREGICAQSQSTTYSVEQQDCTANNEYSAVGHTPWPPVTPSPYNNRFEGYPPNMHDYEQSGWMGFSVPPPAFTGDGRSVQGPTVYPGSKRLFTSPIRHPNEGESTVSENRQDRSPTENHSSHSYHPEADRSLHYRPDLSHTPYYGAPHMMPPAYGYPYPPPMHPYSYNDRTMRGLSVPSSSLKRTSEEDGSSHVSPKRKQIINAAAGQGKQIKSMDDDDREPSASVVDQKGSKQRVISPTSSLEGHSKADEDEDSSKPQSETSKREQSPPRPPVGGAAGFTPLSPPSHSSMMRAPFPPNPYYQGAPGASTAYHHPPETWRAYYPPGPPHGPPRYLPHYGHPHGSAGYHYPSSGMHPPHQRPQPRPPGETSAIQPPRKQFGSVSSGSSSTSQSRVRSPPEHNFSATIKTIKSVAEWQQATLETGMAPSANRCMALKAPIPSKYWGEAEKAKDTPVPDFHCLVNFPDYLTKARPVGTDVSSPNGKRNCVMCGKLRVCSASTTSLGGSILRRSKAATCMDDSVKTEQEEDETCHIIPRQNKGLCTGCDVTVWVVIENSLEIKWCKGCKNFRPWACFGDKGSATKCVRCRDRQREKYALQKDELRVKRSRVSEEKRDDGDHEMAAAKGLRDLMAMGTTGL